MTNSPENGSTAQGQESSAPPETRILSKVAAVLLTIPLPGVPQLWRSDYLKGGMLLALTVFGYATCSVTGIFFHALAFVDVGCTRTGRFIKNAKLRMLTYRVSFAAGFLAMWEASAWELGPKKWVCVDPFWFSSPMRIFEYLVEITLSGSVFTDTMTTMTEAFLGYVIGALLGISLGFMLARLETLAEILDPFIVAVNGIPRVAMAPILIIWFGIGIESKIVLAVSLVLFLTFMNTYAGLRGVDPALKNLAQVMGANEMQVLWKITLPASMPWILTGLKIGVPFAIIGAILGEFMAASSGLGFMIQHASNLFNIAGSFAGLLLLMFIVLIANSAVNRLERYLLRWRPQQQAGSGESTELY
ncbi:MAG: ABC transporter permease [Nitrospinota bacterium]|jgi:NitT/TauT family transport system permease protein|nr:ABC transporter permease [Nitrospinota bacterium]MDP7372092.1 ABC transporter permease [Nitrospinota bacterium]